jgi:acyl carrier protein
MLRIVPGQAKLDPQHAQGEWSVSIESTLQQFIADNILFSNKGFPYADEASFLESGILDSMNVMEIVSFSEKTFGITIHNAEIVPDNLDSIVKLASFIRRKMAEGR